MPLGCLVESLLIEKMQKDKFYWVFLLYKKEKKKRINVSLPGQQENLPARFSRFHLLGLTWSRVNEFFKDNIVYLLDFFMTNLVYHAPLAA